MASFGKPAVRRGRPTEDLVGRRQRIFLAVSPLIADLGTREVTMARAARAARLSVGGLYHYFHTKQDLLMYGLAPDNLERLCTDFRNRHVRLGTPPHLLLNASITELVAAAEMYVRPSLVAASDLGIATLRVRLDEALRTEVVGLVQTVRLAHPELHVQQAAELDLSLRRICATSLLDPTVSAKQLHQALTTTIDHVNKPAATSLVLAQGLQIRAAARSASVVYAAAAGDPDVDPI